MNIGFSTVPPVTAAHFEPQNAVARDDRRGEEQDTLRPVAGTSEAEGATTDRNSPDSEQREQKPAEGSAEAKREALQDPNSALSKELQQLKKRDREVRTHEQAHLAAAGQHASGGPFYEFKRGPDGQRYAVSGHVNIDTSKVSGDPEATLRKAEVVRRAALAPAEPSAQDRRVAAKASSMAMEARQELAQLRLEEAKQSRADTAEGQSESAGSGEKSAEESRGELEGKIRNSGAVEQPAPVLDLVA